MGHEYLVEVWPVGHVFRAGHRIAVKVHAPPLIDSFYVYVPRTLPGINTILSGPGYDVADHAADGADRSHRRARRTAAVRRAGSRALHPEPGLIATSR